MSDYQATLSPSPMRRFIAIGLLLCLGGLLVYILLSSPPQSIVGRVFLLGLGAVVFYGADRLRRATTLSIEVTDNEIRDSSGRLLCAIDNIKDVERGPFAFKPSNGFMLRLHTSMPATYAPGLWWRFGKMVGVGGVTSASETKFMAEMITMKISDFPKE